MAVKEDVIVRRVIVIDDNPDIHGDFTAIFEPNDIDYSEVNELEESIFRDGDNSNNPPVRREKYELDHAFQGKEGVEKIQQAVLANKPYELAFVDMRMPPGWDGLETIEHIWQVDQCVQVIICSAYSDYTWEEIIHRLGHKGSLLVLKKPFDSTEISQLACALTEKYVLSKQLYSGTKNLAELIKQKILKFETARINSEKAQEIINDILEDENLPQELRCQINNIMKNSKELLETIKKMSDSSNTASQEA